MKTICRRCLALVLPVWLGLLPACQRPEEPLMPADLIPREKFIPLVADIQQLEAQVENSRLPPDSAKVLFLAQQKDLFWRREVTDTTFQRSYRYYGTHKKDLAELYQLVIDTLAQREARYPPPPGVRPTPPATPPAH